MTERAYTDSIPPDFSDGLNSILRAWSEFNDKRVFTVLCYPQRRRALRHGHLLLMTN
jgi:hypothetical protein